MTRNSLTLTREQASLVQAQASMIQPRWRERFLRAVKDNLLAGSGPITNADVDRAAGIATRIMVLGAGVPALSPEDDA